MDAGLVLSFLIRRSQRFRAVDTDFTFAFGLDTFVACWFLFVTFHCA